MTLTDIAEDLDRYEDTLEDFDPEAPAPTLDGIEQVNRALARIARIEHRLHQYQGIARQEIKRITDWLNEVSQPLLNEIEWREYGVEQWMRAHHDETGVKTEKLPHGTLKLIQGRPRVEPVSEDPDPRFTRTTKAWDKAALSKACEPGPEVDEYDAPEGFVAHVPVTSDGEVVAGAVLLVPTRPSFSRKRAGES